MKKVQAASLEIMDRESFGGGGGWNQKRGGGGTKPGK